MPSWPIHLAMANKLNKKLNLSNDFIIGNILPDVLNGYELENPSSIIDSSITHYRLQQATKKYKIDTEYFINQYKKELNNDVIIGYLVHLITDSYYNTYTHKHHIIIKDNERLTILKDGSILNDETVTPWQIKQNDFKIYGQKVINDKKIGNVINKNNTTLENIIKIKECPLTDEDLNKAIYKINKLINSQTKYNKENYQMFTEEELEQLFEDCYDYIIQYLNKIK